MEKAQVSNAKNNNKTVTVKAAGKKASSVEDRSSSIFLLDPDVLNCPICFDRLTIPVYQCTNGHVACSVCCGRFLRKCGSCSSILTGTQRCRALEKVLESVKVPCPNAKYGCKDTLLRYSDKSGHESKCEFVPCSCPHTDCDFVSSFLDLPAHFTTEHDFSAGAGVRFLYGKSFNLTLKSEDETIILQEDTGSKLFMLHNLVIDHGNAVNVCCIQPDSMPKYRCQISAKWNGCSLDMQSFTKNIQKSTMATILSSRFMLIPSYYFGASEPCNLEICICRL
ncbi:E3 ubiquitin-protein ligase SINA-like 10 [Arachis stenosperma]|uniref:E3 ubiquitin-protein ligase SINA-like 10 n=1 Tax=Arachis stenosperma TaxID=217475 RepID=UPI0025ACEC48|nr:E3 ubiquitin-protein ligase SINA-like 10 [Arachis stenosperma]